MVEAQRRLSQLDIGTVSFASPPGDCSLGDQALSANHPSMPMLAAVPTTPASQGLWPSTREVGDAAQVERKHMETRPTLIDDAVDLVAKGEFEEQTCPPISVRKQFTPARLEEILKDTRVDVFFCAFIFFNAIVLVTEVQYHGFDNARSLNYDDATQTAEETWPGAELTFTVLDWVFGIVFAVELVMKILVYRIDFPKSLWNLFDTAVVAAWVIVSWDIDMKIDPNMSRMVRLLRLLRLLRGVRSMKLFEPITLISAAVYASVSVLFWALILLILTKGVIGAIVAQLLSAFIRDESQDYSVREDVYQAWGNWTRAMVTMFQITLANWAPPCWLLTNGVDERWALFFLTYKCTVGFAVIQVILSVFIQQTFKIANRDEAVMIMEKENATAAYYKNLVSLFKACDTSGDGLVTREELQFVLANPKVKSWFAALEIDVGEAEELFNILDSKDKDGFIREEEFLLGIKSIKGPSRAKSVFMMHNDLKKVQLKLEALQYGEGGHGHRDGNINSTGPGVTSTGASHTGICGVCVAHAGLHNVFPAASEAEGDGAARKMPLWLDVSSCWNV
eukprot:NODE_2937_length_2118_cov_40.142642.p1 GENE.NODE_2937_length_2118_cov_40.142642~~NODE_2937_length_2118_cov_40.142642.p1  ORF type:complete len:635 (+),score=159.09 NODE_2937_length_2118_cov_40.142642:215-1906(+)